MDQQSETPMGGEFSVIAEIGTLYSISQMRTDAVMKIEGQK